jgi:hypothetical protein
MVTGHSYDKLFAYSTSFKSDSYYMLYVEMDCCREHVKFDEKRMSQATKIMVSALGAFMLMRGNLFAQTNGFFVIPDSYSVQYPSNVTLSQRFTVSNGVYTCWCYGTDSPAAQASNTRTRCEMRWQT